MSRTLTITIAGKCSCQMVDLKRWESTFGAIAGGLGLTITHSVKNSRAGRPNKFKPYNPIRVLPRVGDSWYSLASVPEGFVTIAGDSSLYGCRSSAGLYVTVALRRGVNPKHFIEDHVDRLGSCVDRVDGLAIFVLPEFELAANFAFGDNDVRKVKRATVIRYQAGGFLPR